MTELGYLFAGALLGAATGVPIGAVGLCVVGAATRHSLRHAVAVAIGGGTGDLVYAALGVIALGPVLAGAPSARAALYVVSGFALMAVGLLVWRSRGHGDIEPGSTPTSRSARRGFCTGFGLVAMNPASLVTWVVVVGGLASNATTTEGIALVLGIGAGSASWFVILAHLAHRGAGLLRRGRWLVPVAAALLTGYGLVSVGRGARHWLG